MTKVVMNMEELVNLADIVSASLLDGIRITVRPKAKDGKNYISLCACDRSCQTETLAECKTDVEEVAKFIVDKSFVVSVKALEQTGAEKVTIRFSGNGVTLKAGDAQVEASIRSDMTSFTDCDPAGAVAKIVVDTAEFVKSVKKGGFAYSLKGCRMAAFNDAVALVPWAADGEEAMIKVFSVHGGNTLIAARNMGVEQGKEALKTCFDENRAWFVNATYLTRIMTRLKAEKTQLIVWDKQLMIRNGNTFYCCILGSGNGFNRNVIESMFQKKDMEFAMSIDVDKLRSAIGVAAAGIRTFHNEGTVMEFFLKEKKVTFTSFGGGSKMIVECDQAMGEAHKAVSLELMKKILSQISGSKILLSGSAGRPIMIGDCDKETRVLLAPHLTREEQEQAEEEQEKEEEVEKGA